MDVGFPEGVSAAQYWTELCNQPLVYYPSKSKASLIPNVHLRVVHHILAHTIGARKSSKGVVNTYELGHLYSLDKRHRINVAFELAQFILRQAHDTRTRGIFCGGYITRLLQGMNIFTIPNDDAPVLIKRVTDGPFRHWGLKRLQPGLSASHESPADSPMSQTAEHTRAGPSTSRARTARPSTAPAPPTAEEWHSFKRRYEKDRRKAKRFRSAIWSFMQSIANCFSPPPANLPTYDSYTSEDSEEPLPTRREGKAPAAAEHSRSDDNEDEEVEEPMHSAEDEDPEIEAMFDEDGDDEDQNSPSDGADN